jgi:hypothetical protein
MAKVSQTSGDTRDRQQHALLPVAAAALLSFGVTLMLMSAAYIRDLEYLRQVPGMVWSFLCGVPTENGVALPAMLSFGTVALLIGGGMIGWHWWRRRATQT